MAVVYFSRKTAAEYEGMTHNQDTVYFLTDSRAIYLGDQFFGVGSVDGILPDADGNIELNAATLNDLYMSCLRVEKLDDRLYTAEYADIDYDVGASYYEKYKPVAGACSAVVNGTIIGRTYDWNYDNRCGFVVRTRASRGKHMVIGKAAAPMSLTSAVIDSGVYSDDYKVIPFILLDGVNDAGLFCEVNVVTAGEKGYTTGTEPGKEDMFAMMIPRYVLDYASSVDEAIALLRNKNIFAANNELMKEEFHFLLSDKTKTVVIEFVQNEMVVIDSFVDNKKISTNFYLDGYDGTRASLTKYAMGIERYNLLSAGYEAATSESAMYALMQSVLYSKAYSPDENPVWYSEFYGNYERFGDLNKNSPPEAFTEILAYVRDLYAHRSRETGLTWHTVHTAIYDIAHKKMTVYPQETGKRFHFILSYDQQSVDIGDVEGLQEALDSKQPVDEYALESDLAALSDVVGTKADKTDLDNLSSEVDTKASKAEVAALDAKVDTKAPQSELDALEAVVDAKASQAALDSVASRVEDIEDVIPAQATEENQLADKDFVNSTVATNTATFRGSYNVVDDLHLTLDATDAQIAAALMSVVGVKTNNDYVYVYFVNATTGVTEKYERFKYAADTAEWAYEFTLNNSSFTAVQWAAINSGITALLVATISNNKTAIEEIESSLTEYAKLSDLPTKVSELQNDTGFITGAALTPYRTAEDQDEIDETFATKDELPTKVSELTNDSGYITDSALTPYRTASAQDIIDAGKADKNEIPAKTSDLTNDSGFLTQHQSLSAYRTASAQDVIDAGKLDKSGDTMTGALNFDPQTGTAVTFKDRTIIAVAIDNVVKLGTLTERLQLQGNMDRPSYREASNFLALLTDVPTKTSDLTNDSGFLTQHQSLAAYRTASDQDVIDNEKVDKITGKGLSTNDYTNTDKEIVSAFSIVDGKLNITYEE